MCRCKGLILLETYTSNRAENFELPPFLDVESEVTGDLDYSMYNLSKKLDHSARDNETKDKPESTVEEPTASQQKTDDADSVLPMPTTAAADSLANDVPEILIRQMMASELIHEVVDDGIPACRKNGYHTDLAVDKVVTTNLSKLDVEHGSAMINDTLLQNGHVVFGDVDDGESIAKLFHSTCCKPGAAVK